MRHAPTISPSYLRFIFIIFIFVFIFIFNGAYRLQLCGTETLPQQFSEFDRIHISDYLHFIFIVAFQANLLNIPYNFKTITKLNPLKTIIAITYVCMHVCMHVCMITRDGCCNLQRFASVLRAPLHRHSNHYLLLQKPKWNTYKKNGAHTNKTSGKLTKRLFTMFENSLDWEPGWICTYLHFIVDVVERESVRTPYKSFRERERKLWVMRKMWFKIFNIYRRFFFFCRECKFVGAHSS